MDGSNNNIDDNMQYNVNNDLLQYIRQTFQAYVDAVIPRSPVLAEVYGYVQYYGALDLQIEDYMIYTLNYYDIPLANPTAVMLNTIAEQVVAMNLNNELVDYSRVSEGEIFAALSPIDRFLVLTLLQRLEVNLADLPMPYQNNPNLVLSIMSALERFVMLGYYSEWAGYGSTRLETPSQRILEYYPISWMQVGYPGPSLGYRALRVNNFLV